FIDRGLGAGGYFFRIEEGVVTIRSSINLDMNVPTGGQIVKRVTSTLPPEANVRLYVDPPPCSTAATALGMSLRRNAVAKKEMLPDIKVPGVLGLRANSGPREGAFFIAPLRQVGCPPPRETALLSRLASHVGAGLRLRRRLASEARRLDDADAVLTP